MKIALLLLFVFAAGCSVPVDPSASTTEVVVGPLPIPSMTAPSLSDPFSQREWSAALEIRGRYVISDGSPATGEYPVSIHVGANDTFVFIAAVISDLGPNPFSMVESIVPDTLEIYLTDPLGPLTTPSDQFLVSDAQGRGSHMDDGYWSGSSWALQTQFAPGSYNKGNPAEGRWARSAYDNGTVSYEVFLGRHSPLKDVDGLDLAPGSEFRMTTRLVRQGQDERQPYDLHADTYPGDDWTPDGHLDPTDWWLLRAP